MVCSLPPSNFDLTCLLSFSCNVYKIYSHPRQSHTSELMTQPSRTPLVSLISQLYLDFIFLLCCHYCYIYLFDKFWEAAHNRRELLENFARSKGCDPLLPHFWYNLNPTELIYVKVALDLSILPPLPPSHLLNIFS